MFSQDLKPVSKPREDSPELCISTCLPVEKLRELAVLGLAVHEAQPRGKEGAVRGEGSAAWRLMVPAALCAPVPGSAASLGSWVCRVPCRCWVANTESMALVPDGELVPGGRRGAADGVGAREGGQEARGLLGRGEEWQGLRRTV